MADILGNATSGLTLLITWLLNQVIGVLTLLVTNEYFQLAIILCVVSAVIAIIMRFYKSFGLKRGKRRGK